MNSDGSTPGAEGADSPFTALLQGIRTVQSLKAALAATEALLLASIPEVAIPDGIHGHEADMYVRSALAEIGIATHQSDRSLSFQMNAAYGLVKLFPATLQALVEGKISAAHAREIEHAGCSLDDEARALFEARALERAEHETPGRLKSWLASLAEPLKSKSINARHQEARATRGLTVLDLDDGMSELKATLPSVIAHGILDRMTQIARDVKHRPGAHPSCDNDADGEVDAFGAHRRGASGPDDSNGVHTEVGANTDGYADAEQRMSAGDIGPASHDPRTIDQIRADVLADLALGGITCAHGDGLEAIQAHVQVVVPLLNLAGLTNLGADLVGTGPVDAETARRLAGAASGWDRVMTHPITGQVLATDRYQPSAELRRTLRVRDEHCRFPGCLQPPWRSDIDHSTPYSAGGKTEIDNLAHLCRGHHTLKHARNWIITHLGDGKIRWTSPHGLIYVDTPPPKLRFTSSAVGVSFAEPHSPQTQRYASPGTSDAPF